MLSKVDTSSEQSQYPWYAVPAVAAFVFVVALYIGLSHLKMSWDDGAITAAFARTLATSGRMALTPNSISVEGSSSLLWTALLTLPAFFSRNPAVILIWMKVCAVASFFLAILAFYGLARKVLVDGRAAFMATLLLAFMVSPFHEAYNGMEMNLYLLAVVLFTLVLWKEEGDTKQVLLASLLAALQILDRFEAPFLLAVLLMALAYRFRSKRGTLLAVAVACLLIFIATEVWRFHEFRLLVPNTVLAKRWPPYQPKHTLFALTRNRLIALYEVFFVLLAPLLVAIVFVLLRVRKEKAPAVLRDRNLDFVVIMFAGELIFSMLLGRNWGHFGRMTLGFAPFATLLLVKYCWLRLGENSEQTRKKFMTAAVLGQIAVWVFLVLPKPRENTSIASFEPEGLFAEQVRTLAGRPTLRAMIPDVGGAALCCSKLDILDSALLTNPELARVGYGPEVAYLQKEQPEFIIAHDPWSTLGGLPHSAQLQQYGLATWRGQTAFLRGDIYAALKAAGVPEEDPSKDPGCRNMTYGFVSNDAVLVEGHTSCLALPDK